MKSAEEIMEVLEAYDLTGSLCDAVGAGFQFDSTTDCKAIKIASMLESTPANRC